MGRRKRVCWIFARIFLFLLWPCVLLTGCDSGCGSLDPDVRHAWMALSRGQGLHPHQPGSSSSSEPELPFVGNVTTVVPPTANGGTSGVGLLRQSDCSLTEYFITEFSTTTGSFTFSTVPNYQNFLHQAAQLTTTANQFKNGCNQTMVGMAAANAVYLGQTSAGALIGAGVDYNNNLYIGTVNFTTQTASYQTVSSVIGANYMVAADLNGDGHPDLIVEAFGGSGGSGSGLYVFLSNGDGTFQSPVEFAAGSQPGFFVVDDFNGDGKLDILAETSTGFLMLPGHGDGTFGNGVASGSPLGYALASADLNGDGKKDLIAGNGQVLLGNGDGTFTSASGTFSVSGGSGIPALGDFNNDGKLDVAINAYGGANLTIALGNGDGTFKTIGAYASIYGSQSVSVSDLDGDGNLDIVIGIGNSGAFGPDENTGGIFQILMGNGDGSFQATPVYGALQGGSNSLTPSSFSIGDFNGDGKPDLLEATRGQLIFAAGDGQGHFTESTPVTGAAPLAVSNGLMNGDTKLDAVYVDNASGTPELAVAMGNGDGAFAAPAEYTIPGTPPTYGYAPSLVVADFNGDGHPDVVLVNQLGVYVYLNDGTGTLETPVQLDTLVQGSYSLAADLNGDGKLDLVVADSGSIGTNPVVPGAVKIYLGKGDGTFNAPSSLTPDTVIIGIAVGDLNGDGKPDIVANSYDANFNNPLLSVYLGKGDGTFAAAINRNQTDTSGTGLAIADINGDGKADIVQGGCCGLAYTTVFLGNGDGTFSDAPQLATGWSTYNVAVADINGDGHPDILTSSHEGGSDGINVYVSLYGKSVPPTLAASTTTLTSSATSITSGQSVTFTATVAAAPGSAGTPTGTVTFLDGATTLGTGTLNATGTATFSTSSLSTGTHSITATYGGDTNFSGSTSAAVSLTVNAPAPVATTTALTASATSVVSGTSITFTASVTAQSGGVPTGAVTFLDGATSLGTGTLNAGGTTTFSTSTLSVGSHNITASYAGATGFSASTSSAVAVTITSPPAPDFTLSINPSSGAETSSSSATATLTVTPSNGFNSAVTFGCSGLPGGLSCAFSPSSVTPSGSAATATVTFSGTLSASRRAAKNSSLPAAAFAACLGLWLLGRRRLPRVLSAVLFAALAGSALLGLSACGGGGSGSSPKTTTATVTLTGASGTLSHTVTYTLSSTN